MSYIQPRNLNLTFRMNTNTLKTSLACLLLVLAQATQVLAQETYKDLRQALFSASMLSGTSGPQGVNWIEGGSKYSFSAEGGVIKSYDPATKTEAPVFSTEGLTFPGTDTPFAYQSFQWTKDSRYLLFQTNFRPVWRHSGNSDYYYYSLATKSLKLVAKDAFTAEVSPNGKKVGYHRGGDMFVFDLDKGKETRLTKNGKEKFYNGRFGWAYEEEFGLVQAWKWSHDSRYIAFWESDEQQVPVFRMTDYQGKHSSYTELPYPKVGDTNPSVRIGVTDVEKGKTQWMKLSLDDGYVPRIYWTSTPGVLAVTHLNRAQNHLKLYFFDVKNGNGRLVMEEKHSAWIDVYDFFAGIDDYFIFPQGLEEFFWVSDRDGWNHLYRFGYDGKMLGQLTKGDWEVVIVHSVDVENKTVYYSSTEDSPLERQLYAVGFDGGGKKKITQVPGRHRIDFSPNNRLFIDRYSNVSTPTQVELRNVEGDLLNKLADNASVSSFTASHFYAPRELLTFTASGGHKLDMYVVKPKDFDPAKAYPLVLNIYGGPGAQSVYNEFGRDGWEQWLAQEGYVVASVNNRGSGGYGSQFKKTVYANLGEHESADFVEAARHLASNPWVDGNRMAIRGHSYGGYMASYTMLKHPGVFGVSLVGAPVTDWKLYDSIYAERYMGLLPGGEERYRKTAAHTYAANLKGKMFVAHSAMDENVHVQNTFQLVTALIENGKDADLRIFPKGAHGVAYNAESYVLLYSLYTRYLAEHLQPVAEKKAAP